MTQSATDKLMTDNCPFCDGEAEVCEVGIATGFSFYVSCADIECQGCATPLTKYARRSDAIKAWNTRHNPDANALKIAVEANREAKRLIGFMTNEKIAEASRVLEAAAYPLIRAAVLEEAALRCEKLAHEDLGKRDRYDVLPVMRAVRAIRDMAKEGR